MSDKSVVFVYILINEIKPNLEMVENASISCKLDTEKVQPNSILNGEMLFNTNFGIVEDGNSITQDEISALTALELITETANVLVIKYNNFVFVKI